VADLDNSDLQGIIVNLIDDSVDPPAQSIPFLSGEFFTSGGTGVRQLFEAFQDMPDVLPGKGPKIFGHRLLEEKFISSHVS